MKTLLPSLSATRVFLLFAAVMLGLAAGPVVAQTTGTLDTTFPDVNVSGFVAGGTFPNIVYTAVPQTDGKLILGGNFSSIAGVPRGTLARLNLDQSVDMSFAPSTDGVVYCVAVQPDGKILVGGIFSQVTPGVARSRLARFNADGSLDAGFNAGLISGSGDTAVFGITVQADSKILINGDFSSVAGTARNGVARLNADGSMDPGFTAAGGTISGSPGNVLSLALRLDGKILVGGGFSEMNGAPHNGIALLNANGTVDNAYTTSAANTFAMAIQPNGQVLISGFFSSVNGTPRSGNARLNADGSVEAGYISSRTVPTFSLQTDGRVMTSAVCLSPNGTTSFFVTVNGPNTPTCASHQADGKILLGGDFTGIGGVTRRGLARVYNSETAAQSVALPDSDRVQWFRSGTMPEVTRVTFELSTNGGASWSALGAGVRIAGGWEYNGGGLPASGMVRARGFTKSGYFTGSQGLIEQVKTYTGFPPIVVAPTSTAITSTSATLGGLVSSDGGAAITERGVVLSRSVSNGDPVIGGPNVVKIPTAGTTGIFTVSATGLIPAGDYFFRAYATNANGTIYTNPVATFTALPAGLVDAAYNPNVGSGQVTATAVQSDGKTIVGGTFTTVGGAAHANLARVNADGSVDATFNPTVNSGTRAVAVQFDGKIVIGGGFTQVNGSTRDGLARLNADGTLDTTFNPGAPGVTGLALAADGKIVIGGSFTTVAGTARNRIARLNADGTLDATFDPGTGADDEVLSVSVRASGVVVIGGLFTTVNGTSRVRIAQLFPSGGVDLTFDPGSGANGVVNCVIADENNNVLIGGDFTTVDGQARNRLARLLPTGFLEPKFDAFLNINAAVRSIAVQENGSVLVGGGFTMVNGVARNGLARLTSYGTLDSALDPGAGGVVSSVALQGDGQILVGGNFTTFNGTARNRLARLTNALPVQSLTAISATRVEWVRNGSLPVLSLPPILEISTNGGASWAFAGTGARSGYNKWDFNGLGLPASGLVRARGRTSGGQYNGSSGLVEQQIAVSFPIPTVTSPSSTSITSNSAALGGFISNNGGSATTEYGVVYAPTAVNSNPLIGGAGVTRISAAAGGFVGGFQVNASGLSAGTAYTFRAYATTNAGTGYTGAAAFATLAAAPSIALPTSANVTFNSATLGGTVAADGGSAVTERGVVFSATATNGNPLIGGAGVTKLTSAGTIGTFTVSATGLSVSTGYSFKAYAVNALGTSYTAPVSTFTTSPAPSGVGLPEPGYDPNVAGTTVVAIAVQPDGKAIIGGTFTTVGGVAHQNLARLNANGSVDGTFNTSLNSASYSVAVQADGKILVGGGFSLVNGAVSPELARLNADGTLESTATFNIGNGPNQLVSAVTVQVDGKILIGGAFTNFNGTARNYLARLNANGSLDTSFNPGTGPNDEVLGMAVQDDGKILLAGNFTSVNGTARNRIARLNTDGSLDSGFNPGTGANGLTYCAALQADGKILLGGLFSTVNGIATGGIARLNNDGSLDGSFTSGGGANGFVQTITVQADGRLLCAGGFNTVNGTARTGLARLNASGTLDASFNPGTAGGVNGIAALAIQADGQLLAGGSFTLFNGTARNRFARVGNEPATQSLTAPNQSVVQWLRGGGSPEAFYTSLDLSTNGGASWTPLGAATRVAGGWQFSGLNLPAGGTLRARARSAGGIYTGSSGLVEQQQVFTLALPTVTTPTMTSVTGATAVLGGNVTSDGGATISERGVVYSITTLNNNPMIGGTSVSKLTTTGTTGTFTIPAGGLALGTNYSFKAYATNVYGTTYTAPVSTFTTLGPPLLSTVVAANLSSTSVVLVGGIAGNGGAEITERGVVYSVSGENDDPFIGGTGVTQLSVPAGTGIFINSILASLTGLTPGTTYSARAYATNPYGTTYTEPVFAFTTLTLLEAWRLQYFGTTANTGNAANTADPDGDGNANLFEYLAGLVPTNPASRFVCRIEKVPGFPTLKNIVFSPTVAGRTYVVKTKASLTDPTWLPLGSSSTSENGTERTVTDLNAGPGPRFYHVEITLP